MSEQGCSETLRWHKVVASDGHSSQNHQLWILIDRSQANQVESN
jgi:hypothetical protein